MMPSGDGINLVEFIKKNSNSTIIILTAMGEDQNKIQGLKIIAKFFENTMSKPLLTTDQLILLNYDNAPNGKYSTNIQLNLNDNLKFFDKEIIKYSYMWKVGGEFSKKNES